MNINYLHFSFNFFALYSFNYIQLKKFLRTAILFTISREPSTYLHFISPYGNLNTSRRVTFIGNRHNDVWQPGAKLSK